MQFTIIGCGGHARSVADVILHNNEKSQITFIDENAKDGEVIYGFAVLKNTQDMRNAFIALGDSAKREKFYNIYNNNIISVLSKTCNVGVDAKIENGVFVGKGVHIGPQVLIKKGTIINTHSVIEHEVEVGEFSHISVNATLCGKVKVGNNCFIGAASVIKDGVSICDNVIVGCGSVVVKNITQSGTYIGCPAKLINNN